MVHYGRALARMRRRREDAVLEFRRAELISPRRVLRDPITREVLAELLQRTRRDSPAGRELRGMAYRPACRCSPSGAFLRRSNCHCAVVPGGRVATAKAARSSVTATGSVSTSGRPGATRATST